MNVKRNAKRILIIDDHPLLRQGISSLINAEKDLAVIGEVNEAKLAVHTVRRDKPDLVILDLSLGGASGMEVLKDLKTQFPPLKVLVLSMHDEAIYAPRVLRAGGMGYVMKQEAPEKIIQAIQKVLSNEVFLSPVMSNRLLNSFTSKQESFVSPIESLSDRELEVFTLIGEGVGTRQISEKLNLSVKTIESHRAHIKVKLSLKSATELTRIAVDWVENEGSGKNEQP